APGTNPPTVAQPTARYPASFGGKGTGQTILFAEAWAIPNTSTPQYRWWAPNRYGAKRGNHTDMVTTGANAVEFGVQPTTPAHIHRVSLSAGGGQVGLGDGSGRFIGTNDNGAGGFAAGGSSTIFNWAAAVPMPGSCAGCTWPSPSTPGLGTLPAPS